MKKNLNEKTLKKFMKNLSQVCLKSLVVYCLMMNLLLCWLMPMITKWFRGVYYGR